MTFPLASSVTAVSLKAVPTTTLCCGGEMRIDATGAGACDILHLELGPLDLTLLGLEVILDDCDGGPVVVDITGQRGRGNLLGNLLCGLLGSGRLGLGDILGDILEDILPGPAR